MKLKKFLFTPFTYILFITIFIGSLSFARIVDSSIKEKISEHKFGIIPSFSLSTIGEENKILTEKIFKGKISILNVWSSKCRACRYEHDFLKEFISRNNNIQIVGINVDYSKESVNKFLKNEGNPYNIIVFDEDGDFSQKFQVRAIPDICLIDRKGFVRMRYFGYMTDYIWKRKFEPVLNKILNET